MSESSDDGAAIGNNATSAIALGANGTLDPRAAVYLERQSRLTELQIADLEREDKLRHWSLRVKHISDVMKLTFELAGAFIVLLLVCLISIALWKAAHDHSLVIEAFSVPPDMIARGLTGEAVAAQVQDKLAALQDQTQTGRPADSYTANWGDDVKVQIPDTGMSIGEFYRLLVSWFGHESRITGEVYRTSQGLAMAVRTTGAPGNIVRGNETDMDGLVEKAAEAIYARTQPYRYANYLLSRYGESRRRDVLAIFEQLAQTGSPLDRVWSYMGLSTYAEVTDPAHAVQINAKAIPLAPDFALTYQNIFAEEVTAGHEEAGLANVRKVVELLSAGNAGMTERARNISVVSDSANLAELQGDYLTAKSEQLKAGAMPDYALVAPISQLRAALDMGLLHENKRAHDYFARLPQPSDYFTQTQVDIENIRIVAGFEDWAQVLFWRDRLETLLGPEVQPPYTKVYVRETMLRGVWPYAARALAHTGKPANAEALIARTPLDCIVCLRARAEIAAMRRDWPAAKKWLALASKQALSIPTIDNDWGQMLLATGDLGGAIAKFSSAHKKGPHFADPLEGWGEALMAQNRSDLALAKFSEAAQYAPNWGRLHLKWAEALHYAGRQAEAEKQFSVAQKLFLTQPEKAELTKVSTHG
ncbi:MAG TPA: hypothetical protein VHL34_05915 [Rhizomicrobium sp.]|jgi:tetratricopeptide (TPR) repeat protein|nr:hypothetical protein [Rhizomicrobium sp.]